MAFVKANPNQYLLVGRKGQLENRGVAVQSFLLPGTIFVLVPSTKQEATFEFTQETQDGIPLRFKGIVIYRITDPIAAAHLFDFSGGAGTQQINLLLTHVGLGELRDAVSHMTMAECIEQRKTTLSGVVQAALDATIHAEGQANDWGISVEVAQVAQVYIVDAELRQQLEAELRNEIKLKSDQSDILTAEEGKINREAPVRLLKLARDGEVLREELALRDLKNQVRASEVEHQLFLPRAQQEMRRQMLPLEQAPQIVEAASKVLHGTNLSIYGEHTELLGQLAPVLEVLGRAVQQSVAGAAIGQEST